MNIVYLIKEEIIKRSNDFESKTKGTKEEYNLYEEHIQFVYKYATLLCKNLNVDEEVVLISVLLHDISMTNIELDRSKHNEYSSQIAEEILDKYSYSKEKIELIKQCILNHSSKRKDFRTTIEEQILVDSDALAHFDSIKSIYSLAHNVIGLNKEESIIYVKEKLTKDYNEISKNAKNIIKEKYNNVMNAKTVEHLLKVGGSYEK